MAQFLLLKLKYHSYNVTVTIVLSVHLLILQDGNINKPYFDNTVTEICQIRLWLLCESQILNQLEYISCPVITSVAQC